MLDGVHEVDQVYEALSKHIAGTVRRITGFSKGSVSEKLASFDVLVSNSAVEVGLDFKPERLVFSAHNAPTLIQRLGRLREIDSPEPLNAWCYLPESVNARLQASLSSESTDERVSRETFERAVNAAFADECDLSSFSRRWGELEAYQHVIERADDVPSGDAREETLDNGMDRIKRHYYEPYGRTFEREDLKRILPRKRLTGHGPRPRCGRNETLRPVLFASVGGRGVQTAGTI
jgi:CRISPR-associated endonuclease/helicase Cas3